MGKLLPPVHPGELLKETLEDLGLSMNRLAQEIRVPANRISSIIAGQRSITWREIILTVVLNVHDHQCYGQNNRGILLHSS
jgi:addiction module HigA family antidote